MVISSGNLIVSMRKKISLFDEFQNGSGLLTKLSFFKRDFGAHSRWFRLEEDIDTCGLQAN